MLTEKQVELIKSTVPVLKEHGLALTSHFYKRMLSHNPELKNVFNQSHQLNMNQPKALASAVLAYAANIDNLQALLPAVRHIAIKHCTINIRPEQYHIVGKHLLASIKEVLGDAATPELLEAWAAAYNQLANILIEAEAKIYNKMANEQGGWSGWRPFKITKTEKAAEDVLSIYMAPTDGGEIPHLKPGQFISVRCILRDNGIAQPRQYTVTSADGEKELRISVKLIRNEDGSLGKVSHIMHSLTVGDIIEVSCPLGDFVLDEGKTPVVLMAAGIGITPMVAMLKSAVKHKTQRQIQMVYVCKNEAHFPLKGEVEHLISELPNATLRVFYSQADNPKCTCGCKGRFTATQYDHLGLNKEADFYLCGPQSFMKEQFLNLKDWGIDPSKIHYEAFNTGDIF